MMASLHLHLLIDNAFALSLIWTLDLIPHKGHCVVFWGRKYKCSASPHSREYKLGTQVNCCSNLTECWVAN